MSASIIKPELVERQWAPLCKICGSKLGSENIRKDNSMLFYALKLYMGFVFLNANTCQIYLSDYKSLQKLSYISNEAMSFNESLCE